MNHTDIKKFNDDLRAAILVSSPIFESTDVSLENQLEHIESTEEVLLNAWLSNEQSGSLELGIPAEEGISTEGQTCQFLSTRYRAAVRAFDHLRETPPILDGLAVKTIAQAEINQVTRKPMLYLCLVLATTLVSLFAFKMLVLTAVDNLRADIALANHQIPPPRFDSSPLQNVLLLVVSVLIIIFIGWLVFGGIHQLTMRIGGSQYINFRTSGTVIDLARRLIDQNLDADEAVSISMDLSGLDSTFRGKLKKAFAASTDDQYLASTGAYYTAAAELKFDNLANERTRIVVVSIGGSIAAASLMLFCIPPLIAVVQDLMRAVY
jgi:hypothetical protein